MLCVLLSFLLLLFVVVCFRELLFAAARCCLLQLNHDNYVEQLNHDDGDELNTSSIPLAVVVIFIVITCSKAKKSFARRASSKENEYLIIRLRVDIRCQK